MIRGLGGDRHNRTLQAHDDKVHANNTYDKSLESGYDGSEATTDNALWSHCEGSHVQSILGSVVIVVVLRATPRGLSYYASPAHPPGLVPPTGTHYAQQTRLGMGESAPGSRDRRIQEHGG